MGLLTRISGVFSGKAATRTVVRTASPGGAVGARDQASSLRTQMGEAHGMPLTEPKPSDLGVGRAGGMGSDAASDAIQPTTRRVDVAPTPPKNRQQLFEDLQKNYREAVELIRKVDGHLDRDESRGEQFLAIAKRADESLLTVERMPDQMGRIGEQIIEALSAEAASGEKRLARVEQSLDQIGGNVERAAGAQVELASTMAAFRETMTDIERANRRSAEALESMDERRSVREDEMAKLLATSKTWLGVALVLCVGMGTVAMGIAIASMLTAG